MDEVFKDVSNAKLDLYSYEEEGRQLSKYFREKGYSLEKAMIVAQGFCLRMSLFFEREADERARMGGD